MKFEALKVGELSKRTGLTIRTLHHYDEIGLLKPSLHGEAGYRLYTAADVVRLQQVLSLRQLGFSLEEVRDCGTRRATRSPPSTDHSTTRDPSSDTSLRRLLVHNRHSNKKRSL
jgi:DNA-binding transcriptional MerR regulator